MKIKVVLEPQDEGGYFVYVPSLKGCYSQGETKKEALHNIKEAIELYLETKEEIQIHTQKSKKIKTKAEVVEVSL
jgi:predicted RNase H-like HicB family nuclease